MATTCKKLKASHTGLTGSSHTSLTGWVISTALLALTCHAALIAFPKKQSHWLDTININQGVQ